MNRDDDNPYATVYYEPIQLEWQNRGACRNEHPDIFFVQPYESADEARTVCARCPVKQECGDYAIATNQRYGVWGGMTRRERVKVANTGQDPRNILMMRHCLVCSTSFMPKHRLQFYCCGTCRVRANEAKRTTTHKKKVAS